MERPARWFTMFLKRLGPSEVDGEKPLGGKRQAVAESVLLPLEAMRDQ